MGKFINPFTDWGFKHIFGREVDKDILIEFLNDLLAGEHVITDLRIMNNEQMPETALERKGDILDISLRDKQRGADYHRDAEPGKQPLFQGSYLVLSRTIGGRPRDQRGMGL